VKPPIVRQVQGIEKLASPVTSTQKRMTLSITALFVNIKLLSFDEMDKVRASVVINSYVITVTVYQWIHTGSAGLNVVLYSVD